MRKACHLYISSNAHLPQMPSYHQPSIALRASSVQFRKMLELFTTPLAAWVQATDLALPQEMIDGITLFKVSTCLTKLC